MFYLSVNIEIRRTIFFQFCHINKNSKHAQVEYNSKVDFFRYFHACVLQQKCLYRLSERVASLFDNLWCIQMYFIGNCMKPYEILNIKMH